jgi:hypothetical protein
MVAPPKPFSLKSFAASLRIMARLDILGTLGI